MRLGRSFFQQSAYDLAYNLIGKLLCVARGGKVLRYRIVETEAYGGITDRAAHSYQNRRTKRTESMYLKGGHLYIYFIYGMYHMLNIVADDVDNPEAVLIRAIEPLDEEQPVPLTNGPGKLCRYLNIDKSFDKIDLCSSQLIYLCDSDFQGDIVITKRINIDYAQEDKERMWRFYLKANRFVSKF